MRILFALAVAALAFRPAAAQGVFDPKKDYEAKYKKQAEAAAREHVTLGKYATGKKLHAAALLEYRRALSLDPNCTDAKKALLWKFEGGAWVEDPAAPLKRANEGAPDAVNKALAEFDTKRNAMGSKAAKEFEEIANWAVKKGLKEEAKSSWKQVLFYDDYNQKAREGLGWKQMDGNWVSPADVAVFEAEAKRIAAADAGQKVGETSDVEAKTGWRLSKRTSKHFVFQGMGTDEEVAGYVRHAEAARAGFLELFELKEDELADPIGGVFLKTKEDHISFLERWAGLKGRELDDERAMSGWMGWTPMTFDVRQGDQDAGFFPDWTIHCVIEFMFLQHFKGGNSPDWLQEGLAYWFTYRMTKSAKTNCITFETAAEGGEDLSDVLDWKARMKAMVRGGLNPPIREVVEAKVNGLDGPKGVKAWSLVEWMIATRKKEFLKFVEELGNGEPQEEAVKKAFGVRSYGELDEMWQQYVRENY